MTRKNIVEKLVKEGLSEKTLSTFSDKQITELASRMLNEQVMKKGSVVMSKTSLPTDIKKVTDTGVNVELRETLKGNQKKLDKNHNGKIDAQDFKILKGQKKQSVEETEKPSAGLSAKKKSEVVKAAKSGKDIGKKGKGFKEVEKKAKESGADNPKAVAAAAMWKNIKRESMMEENKDENFEIVVVSKELEKDGGRKHTDRFHINSTNLSSAKKIARKKWDDEYELHDLSVVEILSDDEYREKYLKKNKVDESKLNVERWVTDLAENNYHPFTSKGEIIKLIQEKTKK